MDQKMVILGIALCYNKFSHLCVKHHRYPGRDTLYLSICFTEYSLYLMTNGSIFANAT